MVVGMETLPAELCLKIFCWLDHQNLAAAQQVSKKWKLLASDDNLWSELFKERWGEDRAAFYAPADSKPWKDVYQVQDRCDRVGLGLKIIREGDDYYLVHQGEIQRYLGSRKLGKGENSSRSCKATLGVEGAGQEPCPILDQILFFVGDLEVASTEAKQRPII